jgi:hypothetical protein
MRKAVIPFMMMLAFACAPVEKDNSISNDYWKIEYDHRGINHISSVNDQFEANVLSEWIDADVRFRINDGEWQTVFKRFSAFYRLPEHEYTWSRSHFADNESIQFIDYKSGMPFSLEQTFIFDDAALEWNIVLENRMFYNVEIGDIFVNIPVSGAADQTQEGLFEGGYLQHPFISGDGSFLLFTKRSGKPPYLLITVRPGTAIQHTQGSSYFIQSGYTGNQSDIGSRGKEHIISELGPKGSGNDRIEFGLRLHWADSYAGLRDILYENRLIDVRVVPGMTVPEDLGAQFSLRTMAVIDSVIAEFPGQTELIYRGEPQPDNHIYNVKFNRLGENMLTVYFDGGRKTYLEFFSTEPVETLLSKRSSFIIKNQQHRNPDLWYDGLFSIWDMRNHVLRGPDNTDGWTGWDAYRVACDDWVLGIAPFLASVNALYPNDEQIEAVEYYIKNHVWGGLQRTDKEDPYPYGIHGVPNFKVARDTMLRARIENRRLDKMKIWRAYDYPHIFMLYYHMYQIADRYPEKVNYLDANGYLERMWQTARAFFVYPYEIYPWYDIYKWGFMNDMLVPEIIELLEEKDRQEEADWLRAEWEKKTKYFIYDDPWPYRSEFPTDRTAFESSYAHAKYGATHDMEPDKNLWYDKNEDKWHSHPDVTREAALEFMERQHLAGLSVRGVLEPKYYILGSDARLTYMARMGGWSILDYAIHFADDPHDWLQHGYASYLSSFSLMNTGRPETNWGYWFPGEENDGAMGQSYTGTWAYHYDGEQNLGMGAVTRMATTILTEDPLFGWIAYGGKLEMGEEGYKVMPRDGVRIRFWLIDDQQRVGIELDRDGFKKENPVVVSSQRDRIEFVLENRTGKPHKSILTLDVKGYEKWSLSQDGEIVQPVEKNGKVIFTLDIKDKEHNVSLEKVN